MTPLDDAGIATLLARPDLLDAICAHTCTGGGLVELARLWACPYPRLAAWLYDQGPRQRRYESALEARAEWMVERLLVELRAIALVDIRGAYDNDNCLRPLDQMPPDLVASIESIETDERWEGSGPERAQVGVTRKVKFASKLRAIELLGNNKVFRLFLPAPARDDPRVLVVMVERVAEKIARLVPDPLKQIALADVLEAQADRAEGADARP